MNKKKIRWIIIFMTPALLGIIALQVYWIQHDVTIKEKQLDQNVRLAMNAIVDRIETNEAFNSFNTSFFNFDSISYDFFGNADSMHDDQNLAALNPPSPPPSLYDDQEEGFDFRIVGPGSSQMIIKLQRSKSTGGDSFDEEEWRHHYRIASRRDSIHNVTYVQNTNLRCRITKMQEAMSAMVKGMMQRNTGFYARIDQKNLERIISDELYKRGIDLKYNYGIASGATDSLILVSNKADKASLANAKYRIGLLPNDFYSRPDYLVMNFAGIRGHLLTSMWPMLLGSLIFTLTIIFGFSYSINTIIRQKKLSDIKNDFINNMTHEFKTPIATISLAADAMANPKVYEDRDKLNYYTHIISEENKRMNAQVENVLKMAQFEKGELSLRKELVNINELIAKITDVIAIQVEKREGKIACNFESEIPPIQADPMHLSNVIGNLIDNANKYSEDKPEITISTRTNAEGVIVNIVDKGIGMTRETVKKIFEKFYRVQTGNIHDVKGFGLGLSYVKAIVEQHKGTIRVTSEPGMGSNFEIFLPF
jgi:two-component system, OmpR family, phosphate regulon sensor histidine kinase PhoR